MTITTTLTPSRRHLCGTPVIYLQLRRDPHIAGVSPVIHNHPTKGWERGQGVFEKFKYERIPLSLIKLDDRNPRIVTPELPKSEAEIIKYFFEHENLAAFLKKIVTEGRNPGAERPYVVKIGKEYTVVEGNTRIATYKLLTKQLEAPEDHASSVLPVSNPVKEDLLSVDCAIAPNRDALLPIMANSHFGLGDKSRWGFLGSRKAVYDERKAGKSIPQLANVFGRTQSEIKDLILEYELYLATLGFDWTDPERSALMDPGVAFNPPIRFLETTGHRTSVGVVFDKTNLTVAFISDEARRKMKHLVMKLVVNPERGLGATATYEQVFRDYVHPKPAGAAAKSSGASGGPSVTGNAGTGGSSTGSGQGGGATGQGAGPSAGGSSTWTGAGGGSRLKKGALFSYVVKKQSLLLRQLMKEASVIDATKLPGAGTALLRAIVEAVCKDLIEAQGANKTNKRLNLEGALDLCAGNAVNLSADDKKMLREFQRSHLDYVNLGTHASVVPNYHRLLTARDCIDQFVMRNV